MTYTMDELDEVLRRARARPHPAQIELQAWNQLQWHLRERYGFDLDRLDPEIGGLMREWLLACQRLKERRKIP